MENHIRFRCKSAALTALYLLLLCLVVVPSYAQTEKTVQVTGLVKNRDGAPVAGATVLVKQTQRGATTTADGAFRLTVVPSHTLIVSFLGMDPQEVAINNRTAIEVTMLDSSVNLDDVVVVGYGTMRKRDITGAISSVTGSDIEARMSTSILDALQGQVPGMEIVSGSGQPGEAATVRVRGIATFSDGAASPLYVVDGVPMDDISTINSMDVESVELLKDAASASIYGSRSANGVIIVTTKRGDAQKATFNVKYNHSISNLSHRIEMATPQLRRYFQRQRLHYAKTEGVGYVPDAFINHDMALLSDTLNYMFNANNDYLDLAFRTAHKDQVDASVGGGSKDLRYYFSAGYLNEKGIVPGTGYSRITARINADYTPSKVVKLITKASFNYGKKEGIDEGDYFNGLVRRLPNLSLYFPDETLAGRIWGINPLGYEYATNIKDEYRATLFQAAEVNIVKGLKFVANVSASYSQDRFKRMTPSFLINESQTSNNANSVSNLNWNWLNEDYISYEKTWRDKHTLSALLGFSIQEWRTESDRIYGKDAPTDYIYTMNAYVANLDKNQTGTNISSHAMMSFFSRVTYNYMSKYILQLNVRTDGSSRFAGRDRWGFFPSVSGAWRISDEKFMKWATPTLSDAKFRVSYGVTGNESIGNYDYMMTYGVGGVYDGIVTITPETVGGRLKWEETHQFNAGVDLLLLDRLTLTFDYYDKQTRNLLTSFQLPKETGFSSVRRNIGEISNRGFEVLIAGDVIKKKNFRWNASFNIATNVNKIIKLSDGKPYLQSSIWWVQEGGRVGDFYGYQNLGVFQYNESNAFTSDWRQLTPIFENGVFQNRYTLDGAEYGGSIHQKKLPSGEPFRGGDVNWDNIADAQGEEGVINENDRRVLGNALPDFYGGFTNTLNWKGLTLDISFNYSIGGKLYNQATYGANRCENAALMPSRDFVENMWTAQGDVAKYPRPVADRFQNNREVNSMYIEDASYIRLKSIRLGYRLPKSTLKKIGLSGLEFYAYGTNLLTWTAYSGFDPDISTGGVLTVGLDTNRYPKKREFGFGMTLTL